MRCILFLLLASIALPAVAHDEEHALGIVDFKVSCTPEAQEKFTRAVSLLHHMTYPQARTAFEDVVGAAGAVAVWVMSRSPGNFALRAKLQPPQGGGPPGVRS